MIINNTKEKDYKMEINMFSYPIFFDKIIELGLVDYGFWWILDKNYANKRRNDLLIRYPNRNLIPFAKRDDCDDIACFDLNCGEKVFIIHDFADIGYEYRKEYDSFKFWFENAVKELIESNEDEI